MPTVKGPASSSSLRWSEVSVAACVCRGCRGAQTRGSSTSEATAAAELQQPQRMCNASCSNRCMCSCACWALRRCSCCCIGKGCCLRCRCYGAHVQVQQLQQLQPRQRHMRQQCACVVRRCNNSAQVHQQCGLHCSTVSAENDRTRSAPARLVSGCGGMPYGEMAACGRSTDATERPEQLVRVWRVGGYGGQGGGWPRMRRGCCRGASAGAAAGAAAGAFGAGEGRADAVCGRGAAAPGGVAAVAGWPRLHGGGQGGRGR